MRFLITFIAATLLFPVIASAQNENLDISAEPICFIVRSEAPYKTYGSFRTEFFTREDGIRARHTSNFRLEETGALDEKGRPADKAEFCSYGPFLPGRKLEFTLRTLVPIFSCKTKIDQGEIVIKGFRKPEGGTETWAECYL